MIFGIIMGGMLMAPDPITFKREGGQITPVMSEDNYGRLMIALGMLTGLVHRVDDIREFYPVLRLANDRMPATRKQRIEQQLEHFKGRLLRGRAPARMKSGYWRLSGY